MDSMEFINSAQIYLGLQGESNTRSSISRAYYALYHKSVDTISRKGAPIYCGYTHEETYKSLKKINTKLGILLKEYHKQRVVADYYLNEEINIDAQDFIDKCRAMIDSLEKL